MAAPNLVNVTSIYGKTMGASLGTSNTNMLICASNKVYKVNSIIVSNVDGTNSFDATVVFYDSGDAANYHIAKLISVPAGTTLVVLGKDSPIYLEESDKITAYASAASDGQIVISYEEMDDA